MKIVLQIFCIFHINPYKQQHCKGVQPVFFAFSEQNKILEMTLKSYKKSNYKNEMSVNFSTLISFFFI